MAAEIPIRNDAAANEQALDKVRRDKLREVKAGHDGTWVAHPGLVPVAKEIFDNYMPEPNQISPGQKSPQRPSRTIQAKDLLEVPTGDITDAGLRWNIDVGLQYLHSWLQGSGCVPIYNLMEDAATAEICRAQVWQWVRHGAHLKDARLVTEDMVKEMIHHRAAELGAELGVEAGKAEKLQQAVAVLEELTTSRDFAEFLTLASYNLLD
jgi:malate synthase